MSAPKNDDMRVVALTKRIHERLSTDVRDATEQAHVYAIALGLASIVIRRDGGPLESDAESMLDAIGVRYADLWGNT